MLEDSTLGDGSGEPTLSINTRATSESNYSFTSAMAKTNYSNTVDLSQEAEIVIVEQPQSKASRFRYQCEGRSAGSIPGVNSTPENKTSPTIKIVGRKGPAVVIVSCVTVDHPYRAHPHSIVSRERQDNGYFKADVDPNTMTCSFPNIGIRCVKKKDVCEALTIRERHHIDPFGHKFSHKNNHQNLDLNAVRLCFQAFFPLPSGELGTVRPIVSNPIYDKKATSDLVICKLSHCSCSVNGRKEIILLCEKVIKDDIDIRFFETKNNAVVWEALGEFNASDVHKQVAISFKTPPYHDIRVQNNVKVQLQLVRRSDNAKSLPVDFEYLTLDEGSDLKRQRTQERNINHIVHHLSNSMAPVTGAVYGMPRQPTSGVAMELPSVSVAPTGSIQSVRQGIPIKTEPSERQLSPHCGGNVQISSVSPTHPSPVFPPSMYPPPFYDGSSFSSAVYATSISPIPPYASTTSPPHQQQYPTPMHQQYYTPGLRNDSHYSLHPGVPVDHNISLPSTSYLAPVAVNVEHSSPVYEPSPSPDVLNLGMQPTMGNSIELDPSKINTVDIDFFCSDHFSNSLNLEDIHNPLDSTGQIPSNISMEDMSNLYQPNIPAAYPPKSSNNLFK